MRTVIHVLGLVLFAQSAVAQGVSEVPDIEPCPTGQVEDIGGLADRIDCVEATFMALLRHLADSSGRQLDDVALALRSLSRNVQSGVVQLPYAERGERAIVHTDGPYEYRGHWDRRVDFESSFRPSLQCTWLSSIWMCIAEATPVLWQGSCPSIARDSLTAYTRGQIRTSISHPPLGSL